MAGSFQEILGYAECIRLAWMNHLTGFDFAQSTQTISFTLTDEPLYIHSHHIITQLSLELSVHAPTYRTCTLWMPFVFTTVNLTRSLRRLFKKKKAQNNTFHYKKDISLIIYICIKFYLGWMLTPHINNRIIRSIIILIHLGLRKIDALLISIICWHVAVTWRTLCASPIGLRNSRVNNMRGSMSQTRVLRSFQ